MMEDVAIRLRCDALRDTHHQFYALRQAAECAVYEDSRLYNMPYGRQADGTVAIGSLELLQSSARDDAVQHDQPSDANGQRGRGNGGARNSGCTGRGV